VILYPAIDLRDGGAVRLTQGDFDREQRYGDPMALAATYIEGGVSWIHVVDLNAARTGVPHERETLARIVELANGANGAHGASGANVPRAQVKVKVKVQTGGGIRTEGDVAAVLDLGVARVVMGTAALEDPALATRCARRWPGQVAVGLDYVVRPDGVAEARAHGWEAGSGRTLPELLALWADEPIGAVVATAIARDGMLGGSDLVGLRGLVELAAPRSLPVVASGGVGTLDDLRDLVGLEGLDGVIVGKALVEGRFSVKEAVAACAASV
jgi:phosphoribosylformimino-5-aminoimidazole carboxamide ribotide isomerase